MDTKHTPGPWRTAGELDGYYSNIQVLAADGAFITRVNSSNHPNKANARLIAKAPELAEALEQMVAYLLEAHASELEDCHAGDAELAGEAPEACSYCQGIAEARELLLAAGRDISAIAPETEGK